MVWDFKKNGKKINISQMATDGVRICNNFRFLKFHAAAQKNSRMNLKCKVKPKIPLIWNQSN